MPNIPITNAGLIYVNGLKLSYATTTTLTVATGQCRNSSNVNDIFVNDEVTIDGATNGAAGLDTGSLANSTFYAVYALGDSTQNNPDSAIISTSFSAPALPAGYDMYKRIGSVKTDGSAHFLPFVQMGEDRNRWVMYDTLISEVSAGNATTFTDIDLASSVPLSATLVMLQVQMTPATADNRVNLRRNGSSAANGNVIVYGSVATKVSSSQVIVACDEDAVIEYKVSNGSDAVAIDTVGYLDVL